MAKDNGKASAPADSGDSGHDGTELVRKISPKTVIGKVRAPEKAGPLYVVIGNTHGVKHGTGDNGPWVAFLGSFEATRLADGKVFQAGQCFVPKAVEDLLVSAVTQAQKGDESATVEFAIEVGIKPAENVIGYEYTVKNLVKPSGADPLLALRQRVLAALPAPK
jgi:hypothetical protein